MKRLADMQREFAAAVMHSDAAVPEAVARKKTGAAPIRRFAVYRNNSYASLTEVLEGRFPVVTRLVGEDFFRAMARVYIEQEPPSSAVLLRYGGSFADFVRGFEPAATVPYLADMAALEWAWHQAYHAADAAPLPLGELADAAGDAEHARLVLHPSCALVSSLYPIVSIWELHGDAEVAPATRLDAGAEDALVLRPYLEVEVRRLASGALAFIGALRNGRSIGEACATALEAAPEFDLQTSLAGLMTSGAIVGVEPGTLTRG